MSDDHAIAASPERNSRRRSVRVGVEGEAQVLGERALARAVETRDPDPDLVTWPVRTPGANVSRNVLMSFNILRDFIFIDLGGSRRSSVA